jgi:pimeloyl-ACP methyl ester carboxylesterase
MSTYVLVHGAWHGAWCWYKLIAGLERAGHRVVAADLPGLGKDKSSVGDVNLELWAKSVCDLLDAQNEPVILVGHSRGGILISEAAERRPAKVRTLVYLCAFLLKDGQTLLKVAEEDGTSHVLPNLVVAEDQVTGMVRAEAYRDVYYNTCSDEDIALARTLLSPEPLAPMLTPIHVTEDNFGRVPRIYIECLQDHAIPLRLQKKMYTESPCSKVMTLDTDHSPFFCAPDQLAQQLLSLA